MKFIGRQIEATRLLQRLFDQKFSPHRQNELESVRLRSNIKVKQRNVDCFRHNNHRITFSDELRYEFCKGSNQIFIQYVPKCPTEKFNQKFPYSDSCWTQKKSCPYKCQLLILTGSELCKQNSNKFLKKMNIILNIFAILASVGFSFARQSIAQKNIRNLIDLLSSNQPISPVNNYLCIYDI